MAALAPMPRASVRTTVTARPLTRASERNVNFRSVIIRIGPGLSGQRNILAGRGESRHGLRGTEPWATEAQRHGENLKVLCVSVSLRRILGVSQPVGRLVPR